METEIIEEKETRRGFFATIFSVPEENLRTYIEKIESTLNAEIIFLRKSGHRKLYVLSEDELTTQQEVQQLLKRDTYKREAQKLLGEDTPEKAEPEQ